MSNHHTLASQALSDCRRHARQGKKALATMCFWLAERHIEAEPDPVRYLALTLEADRVVREHFLPESGL